jgi:hypothetical protein
VSPPDTPAHCVRMPPFDCCRQRSGAKRWGIARAAAAGTPRGHRESRRTTSAARSSYPGSAGRSSGCHRRLNGSMMKPAPAAAIPPSSPSLAILRVPSTDEVSPSHAHLTRAASMKQPHPLLLNTLALTPAHTVVTARTGHHYRDDPPLNCAAERFARIPGADLTVFRAARNLSSSISGPAGHGVTRRPGAVRPTGSGRQRSFTARQSNCRPPPDNPRRPRAAPERILQRVPAPSPPTVLRDVSKAAAAVA